MRLFLAIDLPPALKEQIGHICHGLPGVRWAAPEQIHLTIRFIGGLKNGDVDTLCNELSTVRSAQFQLSLKGIGQFLRDEPPETLWIGVSESKALSTLHSRVETALSRCGISREKRKFQPHVTIGRHAGLVRDRLEDYLLEYNAFQSAPFLVSEFALYSSRLRPEGALHTAEAVYELSI